MNKPELGEFYANWRGDKSECAIWRIMKIGDPMHSGVRVLIKRYGGEWIDTDAGVGDETVGTWHSSWEYIPTDKQAVSRWIIPG